MCAPSNVAVDNILERLVVAPTVQSGTSVKVNPRAVRLGHPARVSEVIQNHCLDALIATDEGTEIVGDVRKDIDDNRKYSPSISPNPTSLELFRKQRLKKIEAFKENCKQKFETFVRKLESERSV